MSAIVAWRPREAATSPMTVPTTCTTATVSVQTTRATGDSFGTSTETSEKVELPCITVGTGGKCGTTTSTMEVGVDLQRQKGGQMVIKEICSTTSSNEAVTALRQTSLATCSTGVAGGSTEAPERTTKAPKRGKEQLPPPCPCPPPTAPTPGPLRRRTAGWNA